MICQDKWRNLSVNPAAQGSKDKARNPKIKAASPAPVLSIQNATPAAPAPVRQSAASDAANDDAAQKAQDVKNAPRYTFSLFLIFHSCKCLTILYCMNVYKYSLLHTIYNIHLSHVVYLFLGVSGILEIELLFLFVILYTNSLIHYVIEITI